MSCFVIRLIFREFLTFINLRLGGLFLSMYNAFPALKRFYFHLRTLNSCSQNKSPLTFGWLEAPSHKSRSSRAKCLRHEAVGSLGSRGWSRLWRLRRSEPIIMPDRHPTAAPGRCIWDTLVEPLDVTLVGDVRAGRLGRQINDDVYPHDVANNNR